MNSKNFQYCAMILLLILSTATVGFAQSDTARLSGTITDPQGAAVSGATRGLVVGDRTDFPDSVRFRVQWDSDA